MGRALENFDSDAGFRSAENGQPLDTSGELDGNDLTDATGTCLVRRLYSYATERAPARRDMPWVRYLEKSFAADDYRAPDLMRRIAASENFYRVNAVPVLAASNASVAGSVN